MFNNLVEPPSFLRLAPTHIEPRTGTEETEAFIAPSSLEESATLPADLGQSGFDVLPADEHVKTTEDRG